METVIAALCNPAVTLAVAPALSRQRDDYRYGVHVGVAVFIETR